MSRPSSTSSSRTLEGLPRPGRAVWLALAAVAAVRLVLAAATAATFFDPASADETIYVASELDYRLEGPESPSVLVMGSSRLLGVSERCIADRLGLPEREVSNYSQLSPSFWRTATMLRRNPPLPSRASALVVDVLPFQIASEYVVEDVLFARLATLRERLRVRDPVRRAALVADWFVPAWSWRQTAQRWLEAADRLRLPAAERRDLAADAARRRKDFIWALARRQGRVEELEVVRSYILPGPGRSRVNQRALDDILGHLPENAILHLVWLPTSGDVARLIADEPEFARQRDALRSTLERHPDPRVRLHWFEEREVLGLGERDFIRDGVHLSERGLEKLCPVVGDLVSSGT